MLILVVKDVSPYSIVAGTPAAVKRFRVSERTIECLTRLQWWRYSIFDLFGLPLGRIDESLDGVEEKLARGELKKHALSKTTPEDLFKLFEPVPQAVELCLAQ
jgi:hypothetical protein